MPGSIGSSGCPHGALYDLRSEEVVSGVEVHGAPDARRVRRRRLHPRYDPRQANPRGAVVPFLSGFHWMILHACYGRVQFSVSCGFICAQKLIYIFLYADTFQVSHHMLINNGLLMDYNRVSFE